MPKAKKKSKKTKLEVDVFTATELFNERALYEVVNDDEEIMLPVTKDGFFALVEFAARRSFLPVDDAARCTVAGFIHHLSNETDTTTVGAVRKVLHKAQANITSWRVDQEIKAKRRAELAAASAPQEPSTPASPGLKVVPSEKTN
jgi:hypothetical protein